MSWSFRSLVSGFNVKPSCYGMMKRRDGSHYVVLTDELCGVVFRTESFKKNDRLDEIVRSLRANVSYRDNYQINTAPNGGVYFQIYAGNSYVLAVSDVFPDRATCEKKIDFAIKTGENAKLWYFTKSKQPVTEDA